MSWLDLVLVTWCVKSKERAVRTPHFVWNAESARIVDFAIDFVIGFLIDFVMKIDLGIDFLAKIDFGIDF